MSDLRARLSAGNLIVAPVRGNKDIESRAGNIQIAVPDPEEYARVDASVTAGNLEGDVFSDSKSGLFRKLKWTGRGKYTLHASVNAGNLEFRR